MAFDILQVEQHIGPHLFRHPVIHVAGLLHGIRGMDAVEGDRILPSAPVGEAPIIVLQPPQHLDISHDRSFHLLW